MAVTTLVKFRTSTMDNGTIAMTADVASPIAALTPKVPVHTYCSMFNNELRLSIKCTEAVSGATTSLAISDKV